MQQKLMCLKHNQNVTSVCTFKQCNQQRVCCDMCAQNHKQHKSFVCDLKYLEQKHQIQNHLSMKNIELLKQQFNNSIKHLETLIKDSGLIPVFPSELNYNNLTKFGVQVAYMSNCYSIIDYLEFAMMHQEAVLKRIELLIPQEIEKMKKLCLSFVEALRAQQFYDDGEYEQAFKYIEEANKIFGDNDRLLYLKGLILQGLKKHVQAVNCFNKAIQIQSQYTAYYAKKAYSLNELKLYSQALQAADQGSQLDRTYAPNWQEQVKALKALDRQDEAAQCQSNVLQMIPEWALAEKLRTDFRNQGFQLHNYERYEEAIQFYDKCIEINKEDNVAWNNKGRYLYHQAVSLFVMKRYEESIKCVDQAISIVHINPNYYSNKAYCLNKLGRHDEALAIIEKGLKLKPTHLYLWNEKGRALFAKGKPNEALKCYTSQL